VFFGCDTIADKTVPPSLNQVIVSDSMTSIVDGVEKEFFFVGDTVYFSLSAIDGDFDIKRAVILYENDTTSVPPKVFDLSEQPTKYRVYSNGFKIYYEGNWTIRVFVIDAKDNKSNTIVKTFIVNKKIIIISPHTITFETGEGTNISPISVAVGERIIKPDNPTMLGYSFDGWYKDEQYNAEWNFEADVVNSDMTLYAKWKQNNIVYPYEVGEVSHVKISPYVVVFWTNPDDENFSHVRIIPAGFEWTESSALDKEPGATSYSMLDYLGVEYIIIKSIDKKGNISNGIKYFFD
jgi:uncharacterized repeat protein (TIGR02543 family)